MQVCLKMGICNLLPALRVLCGALFVADREGMNQWRIGETAVRDSPTR
jgi:hypothetical protein